jgi:hypothetical protein
MVTFLSATLRYLRAFLVSRHILGLEAAALRQQLSVYKRKQARPKLRQFDRLFWIALRRLGTVVLGNSKRSRHKGKKTVCAEQARCPLRSSTTPARKLPGGYGQSGAASRAGKESQTNRIVFSAVALQAARRS